MARDKGSRTGCLWAIIALQFVALLMALALCGAVVMVTSSPSRWNVDEEMGVDDFPPMKETWAAGQGDAKVVQVPLTGAIFLGENMGFFADPAGSADAALAAIRRATNDPEVEAILLDVDSGGGGITASDVLHDALLGFKKSRSDRRIVALFGDLAASGAYYVAAAADHIVARPTTVTGSIGVLLQSINIQELAGKLGVRDVTIKSGENKDMLNPFHELQPEQAALLQEVIDELHGRFVSVVAAGRNLSEEEVAVFSDGRVFTASKALELGLVDEIGHRNAALRATADLLQVDDIHLLRYEQEFSLRELLRTTSGWRPLEALLRGSGSRTRFLYSWRP